MQKERERCERETRKRKIVNQIPLKKNISTSFFHAAKIKLAIFCLA